MGRPPASSRPDSRRRLLAAALEEFALHGFDAASVDRIARKARLTKAMLYYHFPGKAGIYREVLRQTFAALNARVEQLTRGAEAPGEQLAGFVEAFIEVVVERPQFARVMVREMGEGGQHLDPETIHVWMLVPEVFLRIVEGGVARGVFRPVNPLIAYFAVIGPVLLVLSSVTVRKRIAQLTGRELPDVRVDALSAHIKSLALSLLCVPDTVSPSQDGSHGSRALSSRRRGGGAARQPRRARRLS